MEKKSAESQLRENLVTCLLRNQFIDAALSAMGYTLLGTVMNTAPRLKDPAAYGGTLTDADAVSIRTVTLPELFTLDELVDNCMDHITYIHNKWLECLDAKHEVMLWESMRIAIMPWSGDKYLIRLIYVTKPTKE